MSLKICSKCNIESDSSFFNKALKNKDGLQAYCRKCNNLESKIYRESNKEKVNLLIKIWQFNNSDKLKISQNLWQISNKDKCAINHKKYKYKNKDKIAVTQKNYREINKESNAIKEALWKKNNPDKTSAQCAKRRSYKLNATVIWSNDFFIKEAYSLAKLRNKLTGINWHVDHIVPLVHPLVCGLHTHNNLQVIPAKVNKLKGNRFY